MAAVFIQVGQLLAALLVAQVGVVIFRHCVDSGVTTLPSAMPAIVKAAVAEWLNVLWGVIKGLVTVPIAILKLVVVAVIELPVNVLWGTVPGLSTVMPKPSINDIF